MQFSSSISHSISALRGLRQRLLERSNSNGDDSKALSHRLLDVFLRTWDLGFTAFGGPPVHFQIFYQRFVEGKGGKERWVDVQTYHEVFAVCQALPGPASTKMLFCLALLHAGFIPALFVFLLWSLPGAIAMYALSLGVQNMGEILPAPIYPMLSGLNASTVGVIALAAVQLADKAIVDNLTRILVIAGACAGLCYSALWYFPLLILIGGLSTVTWDSWASQKVGRLKARYNRRRRSSTEEVQETNIPPESQSIEVPRPMNETFRTRSTTAESIRADSSGANHIHVRSGSTSSNPLQLDGGDNNAKGYYIGVKTGIAIVTIFFASFITILVVRGAIKAPPLALNLFSNMYLAGTIIFGGGPVVIPLLRSYVVDPGWVSSRDFLIGLAIIQALPGPNFNFAVYLGGLTLQRSSYPTILGAFLGFLGIFSPGLTLAVAVQGFWGVMRKKKWVIDLLKGINATAVGLVFTAVYRLWEIGYLTAESGRGQSLAKEPWWVVVAAIAYSGTCWFKVPPAIAIIIGAILGLGWYGAVGHKSVSSVVEPNAFFVIQS